MNPVLPFLFAQPSVVLTGLLPQESSDLFWGWILLLLLILALILLWWLLGPGAKRRRRRMTDLPKPAEATPPLTPKPAAPAGLPLSQAGPPPPDPAPAAEAAAEPPIESPTLVVVAEQSAPAEAIPEIFEANVTEADISVADEKTEAEEVAAPVEPDNLRQIDGIGPKVAGVLSANGIATFAQLAEAPVERLMGILEAEGLKFMKPDTWPEQATFAAKGDWDGLKDLQNQLKAGRRVEK